MSPLRSLPLLAVLGLAACQPSRPPPTPAPAGSRHSEALFNNGGFESGTFAPDWTVSTFLNNGLADPPWPPASVANLQLVAGGSNLTSIVSNAVPESQVPAGLAAGPGVPMWPKFGLNSAVVNSQGSGRNVNSIKQAYSTSSADVDPADGKIHVRFVLAPVLENPGHARAQQPYFFVVLRNLTAPRTGDLFTSFNYSNSPGTPWQAQGTVLFTDWTIFDVAPGDVKLQVGDQVEIEVFAAGCSPSAHWGEVYVDGFGSVFPGLSILKTAPTQINVDTDLTYDFQVKNNTTGVAPNVVADEVLPADTTFVAVNAPGATSCTTPPVGGTGTVQCNFGWMNPGATQTFQVTVHAFTPATKGTATSGAATTLTDTSKAWSANQWRGYSVYLTGGTGAGQDRVIGSNTGTQLTVLNAWSPVPNATSTYAVLPPATQGTNTSANNARLDDTTKAWAADEWVGYTVSIVAGQGAGQSRTIVSNTATRLNITPNWTTTPNTTSVYAVKAQPKVVNGNYGVRADTFSRLLGPRVETGVTAGVPFTDLAITKTDGVPAAGWGSPVQYTITATNNGPLAVTGARVTDTLPSELAPGATWTCTGSGGGSCGTASGAGDLNHLVNLPVGASATFVVNATVVAGSGTGTLSNTAAIAAPAGITDNVPANDQDLDLDALGTLVTVTVNKGSGAGQGRVTSSPAAIDCGESCASAAAGFVTGTQVTLTAVARPGDTFTGWSGGCTGTNTSCTFTVGGATTVTANFKGLEVLGSVVGGNGAITCVPADVAQAGSSVCTLSPNAGFGVASLTDNGVDVKASISAGAYTLTNVTVNHAVVVTYGALALTPSVTSPSDGTITSTRRPPVSGTTSPNVVVEVKVDGVVTCSATADGAGAFSCTPGADLPEGAHVVTAAATNANGTTPDSAPVGLTIDSVAPAAPVVTAPTAGGSTNTTTPTIGGTAEAGSTVTVREGAAVVCTALADGAGAWSCTPTAALTQGSHTLAITATDAAANVSPATTHGFVVDTLAPDTSFTTTPAALSNSSGASFGLTSTEPGTFECSLDGAVFAGCATPAPLAGLSEGSHTFQARARDAAGNVDATPASFTWTVDTLAPDTSFSATPPVVSASASASFAFTSTEPGSFECSLDGAAFSACSSPAPLAGLSEGSHTFRARARDAAGNVDPTPASFTWTVDTLAPDTSITAGPPAITNATSASLSITSTEPGTLECALDGAAFSPCTSPLSLSGLSEGSHTVLARALDSTGNVDATPASRTWVIDLTAPDTSLTSAPPALSASASASFDFTSPEFGATFQCSLDGAAFSTCSGPLTLSALSEGSHTFLVQAVDAAGNVDPTPASHTWTVDTVAPDTTLVSGPSGSVSSTTATFVVTSEAGASFECSLDGAAFAACAASSTWPGLADGAHTVLIRAVDAAGNVDPTPASRTWTVDTAPPDTTIATGPSGTVNSADAAFTFTADESPATFECDLDGAGFSPCAAALSLTALAQGSHTLQVRASDSAGNVDLTPATRTWTVDTVAPDTTLTNPPSGLVNVSTASLVFSSSEGGGTFECSLDGAAFSACTSPTALTGLADGPHTFAVRAIDAAGNVDATPATASWTVDALVPDTTLTAGPSGTVASADASFTFSSTKAGSTFECSLDGAAFAACTTPDALTGLTEGSHTFAVRARDAAGNVDPTPATRTWIVDTQVPDTALTLQPPALTNSTSARFEFTSPEPGATFECSLDGAAWTTCSSPHTTSGTLADGLHVLLVRARDAAGNVDLTPARATWEVDTAAPAAPSILEPVAGASTGALPRFGGLAEPGSTVTVTVDGMTVCTAVADEQGRWSCTATAALPPGAQTATATATDGAGNVSMPSLPRAFTVDASTPDTVIVTAPAALTNVARGDFTFACDVSSATFECSLDGAAFAPCQASYTVSEGAHRLEVRASANGQVDPSPATHAWRVDLTAPPAPTLLSPASGGTTSATPTFTGTAEPGSTVTVSLDGQPLCTAVADAAGNFSCAAPSALPPGAHTASAVATDPAGNASTPSSDVPFSVGGATLDTAIIAGPSGVTRSTSATFAFTSTVIGATFECSLDGAAFSACPTPVTFSSLSAGSHTLEVRAVDGANVDSTPASRTWTIDDGVPAAPVVLAPADQSTVRTRTPRYSGTAEAGSTVRVSVDDLEVCTAMADSSGAWECTPTTPLADGAHRVAAVAVDGAGNASPQSMTNRFVIDVPVMTVAITAPADGALTNDGTPVISGTATPGSTVSVFVDGVLLGTALADANGAWTLSGAIADGTHALTATAALDGLSSPVSNTVNLTVDTRAPVVTLTLTQETPSSSPTATFSVDDATATVTCSLDGGPFAPCQSPLELGATEGHHTLVVRATDPAGNVSEQTRTFDVSAPPDEMRPPTGVRGGGCGCGSTDGTSVVLALLVLVLLASRRSRGSALAVVALTAKVASAQVAGFELERLELNPGVTASLVNGTGDVMRKGAWRASLVLHYEHDPLVLYRLDTNERLGAVVGGRFTTHLVGAWAPLDWLEVGLQLPIVIFQGGDDLSAWNVPAPASTALGTPWLTGRFALFRERAGAPLDLALQAGFGFPLGSAAAFSNTTPIAFAPRVSAGRTLLSWLRLGAELGFVLRGALAPVSPGTSSAFTFGLTATTLGTRLRGEVSLRTAVALDAALAGGDLLFGARYPLGKWLELFAMAGPGLGTLPGNPAFRVLAGVTVQPPLEAPRCDASMSDEALRSECAALDLDGDGIGNGADACPKVPGVTSKQGCPLPDADQDGVSDETDACPKEAGPKDRRGCPVHDQDGDGVEDSADACVAEAGPAERKGCPVKDSDKDGVEDGDDACPAEAGPVERKGCPVKDTDKDGVEDEADACPAEAGPVERKGCPMRDQDADGVEDALDNCPAVAGTVDNAGCPPKQRQLVIITADKLVIHEAVYFATGKAVVLARSNKLLDNVAEVLLAHPEVELVRVEGHTDSAGVREKNLTLSQARADAVKAALVKRKVPAARLHAVGFGPDQPKASNDTAAGREQNRRVEFNFETPAK